MSTLCSGLQRDQQHLVEELERSRGQVADQQLELGKSQTAGRSRELCLQKQVEELESSSSSLDNARNQLQVILHHTGSAAAACFCSSKNYSIPYAQPSTRQQYNRQLCRSGPSIAQNTNIKGTSW